MYVLNVQSYVFMCLYVDIASHSVTGYILLNKNMASSKYSCGYII